MSKLNYLSHLFLCRTDKEKISFWNSSTKSKNVKLCENLKLSRRKIAYGSTKYIRVHVNFVLQHTLINYELAKQ